MRATASASGRAFEPESGIEVVLGQDDGAVFGPIDIFTPSSIPRFSAARRWRRTPAYAGTGILNTRTRRLSDRGNASHPYITIPSTAENRQNVLQSSTAPTHDPLGNLTDEEYPATRLGHSRLEEGVRLANAGEGQDIGLVPPHPDHDDIFMDRVAPKPPTPAPARSSPTKPDPAA